MSLFVFFFFFKQKTAYEMLRSLVGSEMCIRDSHQAAGVVKEALAANKGILASTIAERDSCERKSSELGQRVETLELKLTVELRTQTELHEQLDSLTSECNRWEAKVHILTAENGRMAQRIPVLVAELERAVVKARRAQEVLVHALKEGVFLRGDRDLSEGRVQDLLRDQNRLEVALAEVLALFKDASVKLFTKDAKLGEASEYAKFTSGKYQHQINCAQNQVSSLTDQLDRERCVLEAEQREHAIAASRLHSAREELLETQRKQYREGRELDSIRASQQECEAVVTALNSSTSDLHRNQIEIIRDVDHMYCVGSSVNYESGQARGRLGSGARPL
eukprot:TRINITY_DN19418_c0_g1_i4.p1 TRINITY_DN19418_c0_g1~~TRINITY_DN19418_c0_g1_i4.p1  ORF type:complete len:335 (-),score=113.89 TRINITY_DN19418_c0_g1_i4:214-1218(-)